MTRIILTIASLLLLWVFVGPSTGQPKELSIREGSVLKPTEGYGTTVEKAKEFARKEAVKKVKALMKEVELTSFEPTEEFVVAYVLDGAGKANGTKEFKIDNEIHKLQEWVVSFRTDTSWWREIERRDSEARRKVAADERQSYAARLLAGLAVVLLSGFSYLQLDRYTNYRYTTWLRVGGVGLVSVVLAAFWWIVQ